MSVLVLAIVTAALAVFLIGCAIRAIGYASQPLHLRWELYPVPHEEPSRVRHGGSYFEETGWREKPRRANRLGELRFMLAEVLFLRGLWEFNRPLWFRSYPFHLGLYLLAGTAGLVLLNALLPVHAPPSMSASLGAALHRLYTVTGLAGLTLALLGALALLARRLTDPDLAPYTTRGDLLHLGWFMAALGCLLAGVLVRGPGHSSAVAVARALIGFEAVRLSGFLAAGLVLSALLLAYIPFSHMSHFIGKYFMYHAIRWDDRPHLPGDRMEAKVAECLVSRPTWAAAHVGADGSKTWAQVVSENPAQGAKP